MKIKYPRTLHLPWSQGKASDDKVHKNLTGFVGKQVVVTEKMDGESSTLMNDTVYARSVDSSNHPSRNWLKNFWSGIRNDIPEGWRVCGENLYARHSIGYDALPSYFLGFSVWGDHGCLSWKETLEFFELLGITPVRVLYEGNFDEKAIRELEKTLDFTQVEGYVIRPAGGFLHEDFDKVVGKYVRKHHVQTDQHWMQQEVVPNKLKGALI